MKKRLVLSALAVVLVAGATLWATNDRDRPRTEPARAALAPPALPPGGGGAPGGLPGGGGPGAAPGGFPQPPGGGGFGGQPPGGGGFAGGAPGGFQGGAKIDYKEVVPTLIAALEDDDGEVRKAVALTLARIGQPAVEPLLAILKDKDKSKAARANAAYILGKIGGQAQGAVPVLTKALKESDRDLRRRAAYALAHVISDAQQGGMGGFPGGGMMMGGGGFGMRRGDDLPDPGIVPPSHEKPSEKTEKPSEKTEKPK
ncbi:MAG: HEAT repeat domain-containing protein [Planctomycetes bacterium]|nr:HEAT repeat domain-containing protein [Planctomycetota bacterium]